MVVMFLAGMVYCLCRSCLAERNTDQICDIVTGWRARWMAQVSQILCLKSSYTDRAL